MLWQAEQLIPRTALHDRRFGPQPLTVFTSVEYVTLDFALYFLTGPRFNMLPGRPLRNALCGVCRYCRGVDGVEAQRRWRLKSGCVSPADMKLYA